MNVYTPERQPFETQAQYRERQALSRKLARRCRYITSRRMPQHFNPDANARRAVKAERGARQFRKMRKAFNAAQRGAQ